MFFSASLLKEQKSVVMAAKNPESKPQMNNPFSQSSNSSA